ncbi:DUF2236 domain-containing protein [Candidatus Daviesbacteria bacterium]|nr:DUF2236 domain-containing protein [Candidatus Daviesbacteria bacterium]
MDLKNYGYFGPDSMAWRVWRERIQLLGGSRAIILQLSHPLVAAGVAKYSSFQKDPLGRLNRTLDIMQTIVFGSKSEADAALEKLDHVHKHVKGVLPHKMGKFDKGTYYKANDPYLKLWVHATLIDTSLLVHELFVKYLSKSEKEQFYTESKLLAELLGVSKNIIPQKLEDLLGYMYDMYKKKVIVPTLESKQEVEDILDPKIPLGLKPALPFVKFITSGLLPSFLREGYGLKWEKSDELKLKGVAKAVRTLLPFVPEQIRFTPYYRSAFSSRSLPHII